MYDTVDCYFVHVRFCDISTSPTPLPVLLRWVRQGMPLLHHHSVLTIVFSAHAMPKSAFQTLAVKVVSSHPPPPTTMTFEALMSRWTLPLTCTWPACGVHVTHCMPHAGHVHAKGRVRRDTKASNVIVVGGGGGCGETTLTARVWSPTSAWRAARKPLRRDGRH